MKRASYEQFDPLTRLYFAIFLQRVFAELNPGVEYSDNFHIHVVIEALEQMRFGHNRHLSVALPPRSLKSIIISVAWVAWLLGHDPTLKIICVSYGQELSDKLASDCRQVMQSAWYKRLFRRTRIKFGRNSLGNFETTAGGGRFSTSVGGTLTGLGGDWIILDDPMKPTEALSEAERATANNWIQHTLFTRLNDKQKGRIITVMQRLHEDDVIGSLEEKAPGKFRLLSFPAIAPDNETYDYATPFGRRMFSRAEGEVLHPAREPLEVLEEQKALLGSIFFSAQYLQAPIPIDGNLIKHAWFGRYHPLELAAPERIIQSWDTASKAGQHNDYSVCTTWLLKGERIYLVDVIRERLEFPALKRRVIEQAGRHSAELVLIEDKGSGMSLLQDLPESGFWKGRAINPVADKRNRLVGVSAMIEAGRVYLPHAASWLEDYLHELCGFPGLKHDDQVDSTSQALDWIRKEGSPGGLWHYMREEAEREAAFRLHRTALLRAPHGVTSFYDSNGEDIAVSVDGTVWVAPSEVGSLLRAGFTRMK